MAVGKKRCPVCGVLLSVSSLGSHAGRRRCRESLRAREGVLYEPVSGYRLLSLAAEADEVIRELPFEAGEGGGFAA